ncbi:MAG: malate dehydrogenase [Candidatus Cloacimonetes bacterium HGW-Cloacimonetes-1]|jgi:malate dehydrogenase (oxaloacetate-decarboxylating)|nr:MAG: malate dehydrogenase [Candidatus Cloacimonetes bacterium HGW-Cloacimonetes-1]
MQELKLDLSNLQDVFAERFSPEDKSKAQTLFLKKLSELMHGFYHGKMQTIPKAGIWGFNWFNVWYTPGVSSVSTAIRDDNELSYQYSNRGNMVAVVSDSTRVLGDGDCTPAGGLGVMEGKAMLMKYLGGVDATALCINNRDENGKPDPQKIIDFVKMLEPSFGAVNLEDISQPNCYKVLDELRDACNIPVWHDDAQGTACVTLAGLINALKLTNKKMESVRTVLFGAGASNSTIAHFLLQSGMPGENLVVFDSKGALHKGRSDVANDPGKYKQWHLAEISNPQRLNTMEEAMQGADVLIALSTPGPDTIKPEWIRLMNEKAIVFTCANPVPEIYPYDAKAAGAYIVATGRGDFPNQINNSCGFPGILKGALLVRARKITDNMAIRAAHSLADFAEARGITPDNIVPTMDEAEVFPREAADVAMQAIADGVARVNMTWQEAFDIASQDIMAARQMTKSLMQQGFIAEPSSAIIEQALSYTVDVIG